MSINMYGVPGQVYVPKSGAQYLAAATTGLLSAVADKDVADLAADGCVNSGIVTGAAALGVVTSVGGRTGDVVLFDGEIGSDTPAAGAFTTVDGVLGTVTPAAATVTGLTCSGYIKGSVAAALTAAGTNRATALQLAAEFNNVTTAAASTGVLLPVGVVGMEIWVFADGGVSASAIQVYASGSETIDTVSGSTGVVLTKGSRCIYKFIAANTWISALLGDVSS